MDNINEFFHELYQNFNSRKIDLVISQMTKNVRWANGMDGGYVYGHDSVKRYWERQFETISSNVTPVEIKIENNLIEIKVHQVVHDLKGSLLADEYVYHYFRLLENKIADFDIGKKI
jgi:hypothetical protein